MNLSFTKAITKVKTAEDKKSETLNFWSVEVWQMIYFISTLVPVKPSLVYKGKLANAAEES